MTREPATADEPIKLHDHRTTCMACGKPLRVGQRYLPDASGGFIHRDCCGPERESFTKDGEPLGPGDPIPPGYVWTE